MLSVHGSIADHRLPQAGLVETGVPGRTLRRKAARFAAGMRSLFEPDDPAAPDRRMLPLGIRRAIVELKTGYRRRWLSVVGLSVDLTGRVAVVTGASRRRGIGAAVCRALASHGADVLFTHWQPFDQTQPHGVDTDGPTVLQRELRGFGVRAADLAVDLADPAAPARVLDAVETRLGPPSILVNNAAHFANDDYRTLDAASLDAHYAVNVRATALLSVAFARRYRGGPGGRIISLSSGQGVGPMPDELSYATSKGAIEAFTASLAAGVAAKGITVNAVDPGGTDTGWMPEELKAALLRQMGFGRIGQPEDAARLILFLASDAGAWITGQTIHSRGA